MSLHETVPVLRQDKKVTDLEGESHSDNVRMDNRCQDISLRTHICAVISLHNPVLPHHFHCKNFAGALVSHLENLHMSTSEGITGLPAGAYGFWQ